MDLVSGGEPCGLCLRWSNAVRQMRFKGAATAAHVTSGLLVQGGSFGHLVSCFKGAASIAYGAEQ